MKKAVIIGAGPAGLTAAYELLKRSDEYEVLILEESQEIGGISRTVRYHGNRMDIGGHRFFSKDDRVTAWWDKIMPRQGKPSYDDRVLGRKVLLKKGGPDPEKEDRVMLTRNRVSRIYYQKKFFEYPISGKIIFQLDFITLMKAGFSYLASVVHKKPEDSLENFYINSFGRKLYSMFFEGYTEKLWGRHPSQISADWGAQRTKGLSIIGILKDMVSKMLPGKKDKHKVQTSLIEEFNYPKYGPGQLWETAADEIVKMGGEIRKGCRVTRVQTEGNRVTGLEYQSDGQACTVEGDVFFSSMPLKDLVAGMPEVPEKEAKIAAGLPYRDFVTVGLLVDKLNLKNETELKTLSNIVPDCWIYVQDVGVKLGRIQIFNNWSPYMVQDPEHTVWIGLEYFCDEGDKYWKLSQEKWVKLGVHELIKMGVISDEKQVLDSHRERVKKAYPAYFDTYAEIDQLIGYLNQFENLYCVGRNGQHRYNNMDHSMATSFEAVDNLLSGKSGKENVWSVNTEKEYHEVKSQEEK
ncbi:MAG: NAD(P)/FAD-dependent oxidoreductase [Lachnospiraceae bacterium]|nr:NAD(P)/FAD-dependent oxidoreductase [Lachnospiraceae bacterium]MCI9133462.1 NAD(P)/FAD-dependent oxidoreductase [Lachnospiraceae bacterium]